MSASTTFLHSVHFEYFLHHICQLISEIDFAKAYDCTRGVECQIGHCKSFTSSHQYDHKNFLSEYIGFGLIYTSRPKGRDIRTSWNNWRMLVFSSLTRFFFTMQHLLLNILVLEGGSITKVHWPRKIFDQNQRSPFVPTFVCLLSPFLSSDEWFFSPQVSSLWWPSCHHSCVLT